MAVEILALDAGEKWVGIARASSLARLPEPLKTVKTSEAIKEIQELIKDNQIEAIVVGLPRNLSGQDTAQTRWVRAWVDKLKKKIDRPFYLQDEALTSQAAAVNKQKTKSKADEHSLAAAIILRDWLDTPESQRVGC